MKKTDLLLILAGKYGNWIIKNPSVVRVEAIRNGSAEIWLWNDAQYGVVLYARDVEKTLSMLADIINDCAGGASLDWQLRDQLVTADVHFAGSDDDDGT